jgi:uncharacterized protein YcfJ
LALALTTLAWVGSAAAQIVFYPQADFQGRAFTINAPVTDLLRAGNRQRGSSVDVRDGPWEVCEDARYKGRCKVLRPGRYASLAAMGLDHQVSSVRRINVNLELPEYRYAAHPVPYFDARRRGGERLYEANVISVRAVMGPPERRCWLEPERFPPSHADRSRDANNSGMQGAVVGALLGGILGHELVGQGNRNAGTAGGAVVGAALGAQIAKNDNVGSDGRNDGRDNRGDNRGYDRYGPNGGLQAGSRNVQRCQDVSPANGPPAFWDVRYSFRGLEHRVQLNRPPGNTVTVNREGLPREDGGR